MNIMKFLPRLPQRRRLLTMLAALLALSAVAPGAVDWVLVPGVAFDPCGRRLGYGGGFYDRLLPLFAPGTARVAGAFDVQIVPRVPAAPHDLAVHTIVTETRTIPAAGE